MERTEGGWFRFCVLIQWEGKERMSWGKGWGEGESVFFVFQWICKEDFPQTSMEVSMGSGTSLLGFESELGHLLGQITLLLKNL